MAPEYMLKYKLFQMYIATKRFISWTK